MSHPRPASRDRLKSVADKCRRERIRSFSISAACAVALLVSTSCGTSPSSPQPPVDPILYAVLKPGTPLTFARKDPIGVAFELLPSASVILRLTNAFPESPESINVILNYVSGGTSGRLQYVRQDDIARKRTLEPVGFYEVVYDGFGYSVIVSPPPSQRRGSGFEIIMTNIAANPPPGTSAESKPLSVRVLPIPSRTKPSDVFFDCGTDYESFEGKYFFNCKPGAHIVVRNFTLEGWLIGSSPNCLGDLCWEDWHYDFVPNPDFVDAFYGRAGAFAALTGGDPFPSLRLPGNPVQPPNKTLTFQDVSALDGSPKGVTINSFVLLGNQDGRNVGFPRATIFPELNAWHVNNQGGLFSRHWVGRGPAPAGWIQRIVPANDPLRREWDNTRWPFNPENPDNGVNPLTAEPATAEAMDYVRMNGALFQDLEHGGPPSRAQWELLRPGHAGWIEIHPVDWIERPPAPRLRKTPVLVEFIPVPGAPAQRFLTFAPDTSQKPGEVLRCQEWIDGRFTNMSSVTRTVTVSPSNVHVGIQASGPGARFKAVYIVWWEIGASASATCLAG